jgi:hypothetical protein
MAERWMAQVMSEGGGFDNKRIYSASTIYQGGAILVYQSRGEPAPNLRYLEGMGKPVVKNLPLIG